MIAILSYNVEKKAHIPLNVNVFSLHRFLSEMTV